jgi:hypothetical protein
LVDNGFAGGADSSRQGLLGQSSPAAHVSEPLVVVVRDGRQRSRTRGLTTEAAVMPVKELFARIARRGTDRASESGTYREVRLQSACASGSLKCADVHAQLLGQSIEGQQLVSLGARGEDFACTGDDMERCRPESTIPHAERIHRDFEQMSQFALGEGRVAPELAERVHTTTVPCIVRNVKRPPEY